MPEPIPLPWFDLLSLLQGRVVLYDEGVEQGPIFSLDFYGDRVYASVDGSPSGSSIRGTVVIKNENPIGPGSATPAYINTHGSFTTPLGASGTSILEHVVDDSHNISLVSGTMVTPDVDGLYMLTVNVSGETTSDICTSGDPLPVRNLENIAHYYSIIPSRNGQLILGSNIITYANCHTQSKMVSDTRGGYFITAGTHFVQVLLGVLPAPVIDPGPSPAPSSAGTFTFTMQRVSLGT